MNQKESTSDHFTQGDGKAKRMDKSEDRVEREGKGFKLFVDKKNERIFFFF